MTTHLHKCCSVDGMDVTCMFRAMMVQLYEAVYLLVEGCCSYVNEGGMNRSPDRLLLSGHVFSLSALNVFGVYIGFDQSLGVNFEAWAETDCLLYRWAAGVCLLHRLAIMRLGGGFSMRQHQGAASA